MKTVFVCVMLFVTVDVLAADPAATTVTLELPYQQVLPGVPFDLTLRYRNSSDRTVAVGKRAIVVITPVGGKPTRMAHFARINDPWLSPRPSFILQPGEEAIGVISWYENFLHDDAAFSGPGQCDISMELSGVEADLDDGVADVGTILTSSVRLTRIEPEGEDAEVWQRLKEVSRGHWPSRGFGSTVTRDDFISDEIVEKHRNSGYYPYALLLGHSESKNTLAMIRDAVERFHHSPVYPRLLGAAAVKAASEARKAEYGNGSFEEIERYLKLSLFYFQEAANTGNAAIQEAAIRAKHNAEMDLDRIRQKRAEQPQ